MPAPSSSASSAASSPSHRPDVSVRALVSPDPYLRREACERWTARWQREGAASVSRFDCSEHSLAELIAQAASNALFAPRQVLVAERIESVSAKEHGPLLHYLASPNPNTLLLFSVDKLDGRSKLAQMLQKAGCVELLTPPAAHELVGFIQARAKEQGSTLAPKVADMLAERVGPDVGLLMESLRKLALSAVVCTEPVSSRAITPEDVADLVVPTREASIFVLTEALGEGPHEKASRALSDLLQGGEEPLIILAMLIRQVRLLLAAKTSSRVTGVPPFVARQLTRQAQALSKHTLVQTLSQLQACDVTLKRSGLPPALALERAIWPLTAAAQQGRA